MGILMATVVNAADRVPAPEACQEVQTCGDPNCCAHCGCRCCCEKYCKVVCVMKEVKKTVWAVKCEDFCAPLPGCPSQCESCNKECCQEPNCAGCDKCCNPCASLEGRNYVPPKCGKVRTKKTLEKKEIICKIPSYKCIVVYACANCGSKCGLGEKAQPQTPSAPASEPTQAPPKSTSTALRTPVASASYIK
jgi:hypothetical protein